MKAVSLFKVGDKVFYTGQIDRAGFSAERQAVDEQIVGPKAKSRSFAKAAALHRLVTARHALDL